MDRYPIPAQLRSAPVKVEVELDLPPWHQQHDQGSEGACVGFGTSMALWILNMEESKRQGTAFDPSTRYDPWWLWREARLADEWPDNDDSSVSEGTFVRAACDVLRVRGHCVLKDDQTGAEDRLAGILKNVWARTTYAPQSTGAFLARLECAGTAGSTTRRRKTESWIGDDGVGRVRGGHCVCIYGASDDREAVKLKNSWGTNYPEVCLPYDVLERELQDSPEEGEAEVTLFTDRPNRPGT